MEPAFTAQLRQLVLDTGAYLRQERQNFSRDRVEEKSGANDLVSYVDRTAEQQLMAGCRHLLPGSGFIREEGEAVDPNAEWRWIIDPLDGTTNFVQDIPAWCISIALQRKTETVMGMVYDVPREELFEAQLGGGATRNGESIQVSETAELNRVVLATGFPYLKNDSFSDYLAALETILRQTRGMRRFGAAALDLAWVACGRIDVYYEMGLNPWDAAAGELIVREAGGTVSDFGGTDNFLFGKQIVASNGAVHQEMLRLLRPLA